MLPKLSKFMFLFVLIGTAFCQNRNLFTGKWTESDIREMLLSAEEFRFIPKAGDRNDWEAIPATVRNDYIARSEQYSGASWVTPKASMFLDFVRNGNRSRYQGVRGGRRNQLQALVLGECMEGKGRFLDDIVNGVWTICEETYWGVPAHVGMQERGPGLPDVTEPTVDLFAAETGMQLAWTYYLVGAQLDSISPLIGERIRYEIGRRILDPCLERQDFWWMGYGGRIVNNWNPWICSNWLTTVLILEEDSGRRRAEPLAEEDGSVGVEESRHGDGAARRQRRRRSAEEGRGRARRQERLDRGGAGAGRHATAVATRTGVGGNRARKS